MQNSMQMPEPAWPPPTRATAVPALVLLSIWKLGRECISAPSGCGPGFSQVHPPGDQIAGGFLLSGKGCLLIVLNFQDMREKHFGLEISGC
jgi:hypothetical protein